MKKSLILATAIAAMTTVAYAQDGSPQNCPTGYQCIPPPKCPPGYRCILTDPNAAAHAAPDAAANDQEHEKAEQAWEPKTTPDPDDSPGAGPNDVSVEDYNHPDPCWSLRRQYMTTRSSDSWWRFQNCLAQHNYNN